MLGLSVSPAQLFFAGDLTKLDTEISSADIRESTRFCALRDTGVKRPAAPLRTLARQGESPKIFDRPSARLGRFRH